MHGNEIIQRNTRYHELQHYNLMKSITFTVTLMQRISLLIISFSRQTSIHLDTACPIRIQLPVLPLLWTHASSCIHLGDLRFIRGLFLLQHLSENIGAWRGTSAQFCSTSTCGAILSTALVFFQVVPVLKIKMSVSERSS